MNDNKNEQLDKVEALAKECDGTVAEQILQELKIINERAEEKKNNKGRRYYKMFKDFVILLTCAFIIFFAILRLF